MKDKIFENYNIEGIGERRKVGNASSNDKDVRV